MKKTILLGALIAGLAVNLPAFAKTTSVSDLKDFSIENTKPSDKGKAFDTNHWAYRTLKNVTDKYGVLIGRPGENFDGTKPISRNEAAIILVNLMGKVEDRNIKMSEADKAKIEILQQELESDIAKLSGRVATLENSVTELKGTVATIQESNQKTLKTAFGEDFKITGGIQAVYTAMPKRGEGANTAYTPNFGLPYGELTVSGKVNDKLNYVAQMVPTRTFAETTTAKYNGILRDAYIASSIIPKHTVYFGQIVKPVGREALLSPMGIDFIDYSQSSRKLLSNDPTTTIPYNHDVGAMISGDWDFASYSLGTFNGSSQNALDGNHRTSLAGQFTVKPLYKMPELGSLEAGGSYLTAKKNAPYTEDIFGTHLSYTYKKFNVKGEFLAKDGFQNANQRARGYFIDTKYNLTNKWQLLARYDRFDGDAKSIYTQERDNSVEYVAGVNYLFSDNLLFMVNLANIDNKAGRNSHRLGFLTQVMF
jgi:hypothetical protein